MKFKRMISVMLITLFVCLSVTCGFAANGDIYSDGTKYSASGYNASLQAFNQMLDLMKGNESNFLIERNDKAYKYSDILETFNKPANAAKINTPDLLFTALQEAGKVNSKPTATVQAITGVAEVGQTLTGHYTYNDVDNDAQGVSTFKWFNGTLANGTDKQVIPNATNTTYALTQSDFGKYIFFEATPVDFRFMAGNSVLSAGVRCSSNQNNILTFSLPQQKEPATINTVAHTVAITVAYGTDVTNLVPTFTLSAGATAKVGEVAQVSNTTVTNFTNPVVYTVKADNNTAQEWTVTLTVAKNSAKEITSFTLEAQMAPAVINPAEHTVNITVANGTDVKNLVATFGLSAVASAKVGETAQVNAVTANDFTNPVVYTVNAEDDTTQNWTVTVRVGLSTAKQIATFTLVTQLDVPVIDGVANTVRVTVPYGTNVTNLVPTFTISEGASAKVGQTPQVSGQTANNFTNPVTYTVVAADLSEKNWVVTVVVAPNTEKAITAFSIPQQIGQATIDAQNRTVNIVVGIQANTTNFTPNFTLSAGALAFVGETQQVSTISTNNFAAPVSYTVKAADQSTQVWVVTVSIEPSVGSFTLTQQAAPATINFETHTVNITVVTGTNLTALIPTFTLPAGITAKIGQVAQTSGVTANNFTNPVTYTLSAANGQTQNWIVTVHIAAMEFYAADFRDGDFIPLKYGNSDGTDARLRNEEPVLNLQPPVGATHIAIIMYDISIPGDDIYVHLAYSKEIATGQRTSYKLNPYDMIGGYQGPWPPIGSTHIYRFEAYALNSAPNQLQSEPYPIKNNFDNAIAGKIICKSSFDAKFTGLIDWID